MKRKKIGVIIFAAFMVLQIGQVASAATAFDFNFTLSSSSATSGKANTNDALLGWAKPDSGNLSSSKYINVCTVDTNKERLSKYGKMIKVGKTVTFGYDTLGYIGYCYIKGTPNAIGVRASGTWGPTTIPL
ncbi:MAG: hypothetical protein ACERKZ_17545 [Lachnotalea sp.]